MHALWFKYLFFLFSVQPFVVVSHGRYYVQYVPLIAAALAVVFAIPGRADSTRRGPRLDRWIVGGGQALALVLGAAVLTGWVLVS